MSDQEDQTTAMGSEAAAQTQKPAVNYFAWIGPVVTFVGALSYFLFFVQFPDLRDFPWVNFPLISAGLLCSLAGLRRVFSHSGYQFLSKAFASLGFLFSLALGALFCFYIFDLSYQMPGAEGVPQVADSAPSFLLIDQDNQAVNLANVQGKKLVIAFYRGYW